MPSSQFVSLFEMQQLAARDFVATVAALRDIQNVLNRVEDKSSYMAEDDRPVLLTHLDNMIDAINDINSRSALKSAGRLKDILSNPDQTLTYSVITQTLADIESRFADHLEDIRMFVVSDEKARYLDEENISANIWLNFHSASFDVEESANCIALGRHTASVFHSMRVLEIGIRSFGRYLDIDDPTKPAQRNWAFMLKSIKDKLDALKASKIKDDKEKAERCEGIYTTLDAIRNPWRNATMHVENVYAPHDAIHIYNCVEYFMDALAQVCDEDGDEAL